MTTEPSALLAERLTRALDAWLSLQAEAREQARSERAAARRREAIRAEVGRLLSWAVLFAVYAGVVGAATSRSLERSLLIPHEAPDLLGTWARNTALVAGSIPDAVRTIALPIAGSLLLLMFRATSLGLRANAGGALLAGLVVLALLALSAAATVAPWGTLAAVPGMVTSVLVVHELCVTIHAVDRLAEPRPRLPVARRPFLAAAGALDRLRDRLTRSRSAWARIGFLASPGVSVVMIAAGVFTYMQGQDLLYLVGLAGLLSLLAWSALACAATPAATRIPLWSVLGWAALLSPFLSTGAAAFTFIVSAVAVLYVNVAIATRARQPAGARPPGPRHRGR